MDGLEHLPESGDSDLWESGIMAPSLLLAGVGRGGSDGSEKGAELLSLRSLPSRQVAGSLFSSFLLQC